MALHIALFGFGSVGKATAEYLTHNTLSQKLSLKYIFTRSPQKVIEEKIPKELITNNWQEIIEDKEINCVVELMGGIEFAKEIIIASLKSKKHVITANKALLAFHGNELFKIAKDNGVSIAFEASCGGGIPIIKALTEGLVANTHSAIYGVMNGTCNFILTEMANNKLSFQEALKLADSLGLTEADPSLDIDGLDAGHKIAILASLTFKIPVDFAKIPIVGISQVDNKDIYFGSLFNYTIKLIAAAIKVDNAISIWVHPAFLSENHPMQHVEGPFNVISTIGDEVGHTLYYGRGAGGKPTNSAIISDLIGIENNSYPLIFNKIADWTLPKNSSTTTYTQEGISSMNISCYLRMQVIDLPGTLTAIASLFAKYDISIARMLQEDQEHRNTNLQASHDADQSIAELIIITHTSCFSAVKSACDEIATLSIVVDTPSIYPIIDAPKDHL